MQSAPGDWRQWLLLAFATRDPWAQGEHQIALQRLEALGGQQPEALNYLAFEALRNGRDAVALPWAERALRLAPHSAYIADTCGQAHFRLRHCPEAFAAEDAATERAIGSPEQALFRSRRDHFAAQCEPTERAAAAVPQ